MGRWKGEVGGKIPQNFQKQTLKNSFSKVYVSLVGRRDAPRNGAPTHSFHFPEASSPGAFLRPGWPDNRGGLGRRKYFFLGVILHSRNKLVIGFYAQLSITSSQVPQKDSRKHGSPSIQTAFCFAQFGKTYCTQGLGLHVDIKRQLIRPINIRNPPVQSSCFRQFRIWSIRGAMMDLSPYESSNSFLWWT